MGIARDLVALEVLLRERSDIDLFSPMKQSDLSTAEECTAMITRLSTSGLTDPAAITRLCLQALRIQHEEARSRLLDAEFVATLPPDTPSVARPTESVVREMIGCAKKEIILLGYELTESRLVEAIAERATLGADVIIICDRGRGSARRVLDAWPTGVAQPRVFHDRERSDGARYASMHAKCVLVDGTDLLVTSANFTFHGLHGNIEMGIRVSGVPATEARRIFSHLVESKIVEQVERI